RDGTGPARPGGLCRLRCGLHRTGCRRARCTHRRARCTGPLPCAQRAPATPCRRTGRSAHAEDRPSRQGVARPAPRCGRCARPRVGEGTRKALNMARVPKATPGKRAPRKRRTKLAKAEIEELFSRLAELNPSPTTELEFSTPYELLVAVALSAQSTDVGVNKATRKLFPVANTPA